jgi:hypothetical protein
MEVWKDVVGFKGSYQVSNLGRVRSLDRKIKAGVGFRLKKGQILQGALSFNGYINFRLWKDNKLYNILGHRLACLAFILNPDNKKEVNHKNGLKYDNNINNLEWCTRSENTSHAINTRLQKIKRGILTEEVFNKINERFSRGDMLKDLFIEFNITKRSFYYRKKVGFSFDLEGYLKA